MPEFEIKDSGQRTEFPTGSVRDMHEGKGRCDLMPLGIMAKILRYKDIMKLEGTALDQFIRFLDTKNPDFLYSAFHRFACAVGWDIPTAVIEVSKHFEEGAKKYGERNWQEGIPAHSYVDSGVRHYLKWMRGDTDEPHDRAVLWNWVCLLWTIRNKPDMNDLGNILTGDMIFPKVDGKEDET